jgi:hypothetical protein
MYELDTSGFCILGNIIAFTMATEVSVVFIHVPETSQAPLDATPQILPPVVFKVLLEVDGQQDREAYIDYVM